MRKEEQYLTSNMHKEMLKLIRRTIIFDGGKCMKKQVKKWLTLIMAFALILGSVKYSPLSAEATGVSRLDSEDIVTVTDGDADEFDVINEEDVIDEGDVPEDIETVSGDMAPVLEEVQMFSMERSARLAPGTYVFGTDGEMFEAIGGYGYSQSTDDDGKITITYKAGVGWPEIQFRFPKTLEAQDELRSVKSIKLNVTGGEASNLAIKILDAENNQAQAFYNNATGTNELSAYATGSCVGLALTYNGTPSSDVEVEIGSVELSFHDEKYCNKVYTVAQLPVYSASSYDASTNTFSYTARNEEAKFNLPEYVLNNVSNLKGVHFNVEDQKPDGAQAAYKLYIDDMSNWQNAKVADYKSNKNSADLSVSSVDPSKVVGIGIMNNSDEELTLKVKNVTYTFVDDGNLVEDAPSDGNLLDTDTIGGDKGEDKYLYATVDADNFSQIKRRWDNNTTGYSFNASNKTVSLTGQGEWLFTLQEPIDISKVNGIKLAMSDSAGSWAYKTIIDGKEDAHYGLTDSIYTFPLGAIEGTLTAIVIYSGDDNFQGAFHGMWVDMKSADEPTETYTITVYPSALEKDWGNVTSAKLATDNRWHIAFAGKNSEVRFKLPTLIKMEDCKSITFNVKDQNGPLNFAISLGESKKGNWYWNSGKSSYVLTKDGMDEKEKYTDTFDAVNVQLNDTTVDASVTLDSIVFTMMKTADQEDQVYGELPTDEPVDLTVNTTPVTTSEFDKRYTIKDGGLVAQSSDTVTCNAKDIEKVELKFTGGAWSEIKFKLPEELVAANIKETVFAISDESVTGLAFKLYDATGNEVGYTEKEGSGTATIKDITGNVASVAIMLHDKFVPASGDATCLFDGVLFKMNPADMKTHEVTFSGSDLEVLESEGGATYTEADGKYTLSFPAQNAGVSFKIPKTINLANCVNVQITVSGQTGWVNYYLQMDGQNQGAPKYNNKDDQTVHTVVPTLEEGGINGIKVQQGGDYESGAGVTLEKITFTMKGTDGTNDFLEEEEPNIEVVPGTDNITPAGDGKDDISYQAGTLKIAGATSAEYVLTDTNQYQVKFAKQYEEIKLNLATPIDLLQCTGVTFAVSKQDCPLSFKLYLEDGSVVPEYDKEGETLYEFPRSRTGKVVAVGVMLNKDLKDKTCVFDGVCFTMDTSLSTVTELVEFPASELTAGKTQNATYTVVNGEYVIDFSAVNSEMWFTLPETVNMANCINVIFEVSGQTQPLNFYVGTEEAKLESYWYKSGSEIYNIEAFCKNKIDQVCVQLGNNQAEGTVTLKKVSFLMRESNGEEPEPDVPDEPTIEGTPNITPEGEYSYQAGTLAVSVATSAEYAKTTTNQIKADFVSQYKELKLTLPEAINLLQCKSVTFAVSEQSAPLAFKLYNDKNDEIMAKYDQTGSQLYTFDISSTEKVKYVAVMLNQNLTDVSCVFDGVVFEVDPNATTETYTITYQAHELTLKSSEAASCELENGNWMIKFSDRDQNVNFKLPASVNLEKCVNIIVTVATQNGPMNFNVSLDNSKLKDYYYNTGNTVYTLEPGIAAKINEIGVQCGRENDVYVPGSFIELVSVSFLMKGTEPKPAPADNNYTMDFLEVDTKSADVTEVVDENGTATITFPKKDDSITYVIPDSVDTNHLTSIQFLQSLSGVKVEVLNAKGKVLASGTDSILQTNCNPDAKYIRLVSLADNTVLTLNSVKFNVDPNAFEAIVLNGKFDREDVSMWGAAVWGNATITAKTSDTEIGDGIYTYGEITGRESPYHCFAQDVSDRTEHQTGYVFSFWAKLSDDYKGAPPELRTVEFSPYYIDANGNTNYSMYREGAYKQVLEPGVWTRFSGVVNLPSGAKGFIIRVVEQGTNYGQGTCLKGSFAITDVSLSPTSLAEEPNYKWGGGGNRSNTITKEATCEVTYELKDLSIDWASAKANAEKTGMKAEFTNNYDEVRLKLPRTLDMSTCAYIRLNVPAQNVPIALKLYRKGKQVDVSYYNDISGSYLLVPEYDGMIDAIGIMSLSTPNPAGAFMLADLITFGLTQEPAPEEVSNNIVINGDFADEDMSDWSAALWGDGVTITQHTANKPIYGNTYTYATYSRRTSPYQCFAQDITGRVQQNETYTFSFWARLSNDYKGAPENQRVVQFAPYTVDKSGKENYNPRLDGVYSQVLEPGVWTYFEGTYKVTNDNPISKVVIRILEQGTNYGQGDCVKGSYSVAGVQMARYIPDPPSIDEDVPNLKDAMAEVFGDDFITGTAVTLDEMEDVGIEMLVNKHFNAVTIGNELKPDALFNYSNNEHTPLQTITFNGEKLEVPTLYFGRAEEILDTLKTWNESHPDDPVKVRGHVLVWHSQTPEWFFREGYTVKQNADGSENYVTPEVMNLRLEWYIKTVLEHFTGEDSPYKDMFYGWDVVNEAIYNGYRTDKVSSNEPLSQSTHSANSSWWAVYQSNEFIINAFRFANQYAPADVELYYNDYNDSDNKKVVGIVKLLKDVQEAEGTRIDGMGMQGHYNMVSPTIKEIERAIRDYSEVVDKVMYTEFDMKVSGDISREELLQKEYITQAERYHDIYVLLKKLNAEDGINIGGFTVWGTVDKYSWLQSSSSVGGGADGDLTQCPLLFDSNYKVKPSYWALVDYTMVDPNWTEETTEAVTEETKPEIPETPETVDTPESQPEAEPVVETNPVIEEQKKNNPALVVGIAVGAVVLGAGGGAGFYFTKKRKKITK